MLHYYFFLEMKNILNQKIVYRNYLSTKLNKLTDSLLNVRKNLLKNIEQNNKPINFENNFSNDMDRGIALEYFHNLVLISNQDENQKKRIFYFLDNISLSFPQLVLIKKNEKEILFNSPFSLRIHTYFCPLLTNEYFFKATYLNGGFHFYLLTIFFFFSLRLKINGILIIDKWIFESGIKNIENENGVHLTANSSNEIIIEYFNSIVLYFYTFFN